MITTLKNSSPGYQYAYSKIVRISMTSTNDDEMAYGEHVEEFSQRFLLCLGLLLITIIVCFVGVKDLVRIFQAPALGVKFLQYAPGDYLFASLKIVVMSGILLLGPAGLVQVLLYISPVFTKREQDIFLPIGLISSILFIFGLAFSYFFLVPAALKFFISYGVDVIEPFWSFEQYFDFFVVLIFATGLAFQVPAIQVLLGLCDLITGKTMLSAWKYVALLCTIFAALITPSTDPLTQGLLSIALLSLYLGGAIVVILLKKEVLLINAKVLIK